MTASFQQIIAQWGILVLLTCKSKDREINILQDYTVHFIIFFKEMLSILNFS